jgi:hypothetical protein
MKTLMTSVCGKACLPLALTLLFVNASFGQGGRPAPPASTLDKYEAAAAESVEVTLDEAMLRLAAKLLPEHDADGKRIKALVGGLRSVYVRVLRFDREGAYDPSDVEAVRAQFRAPGWSRVAEVRSGKAGRNLEVYVSAQGGQVNGLSVIATEPRELIYVNIDGPVDPQALSELEGRLSIPKLEIVVSK